MAINTSNDKVRIISTTVSGLATNSKFSDITSPALVVNTSEGGVFYTTGDSSKLTQLAALPGHTHSYLPLSGGTITGDITMMAADKHNTDQYINFKYSTTDLDNYSWRIGYRGTGEGNANNFVIQTNGSGAWTDALKIGLTDNLVYCNVTGNLTGNVTGNVTGIASKASTIYINNSTGAANFPLTFVSGTTKGYNTIFVSTGKSLTFNPSTGNLTATTFTGDVTGIASGNLPLTGGTVSGQIKVSENYGILFRHVNPNYLSGISYDTGGNECIAIWAKNSVTRLRWHAGIDMSDTVYNKMMTITPDFEISKASGTAIGYIAGNTIIHTGNYTTYCASVGHSHNYAASSHTHTWANISSVITNRNEFCFVPSGYNNVVYFNWRSNGGAVSDSSVTGYIFCNGHGNSTAPCTASNFITSSDKRLKTNIKEIDNSSKSLELNFYEFDYKDNDNHSAGHIAQEVKEVLPEFVHEDTTEEHMLSIDYTGLHSIQIKALIDEINKLKEEIRSLKASNVKFK